MSTLKIMTSIFLFSNLLCDAMSRSQNVSVINEGTTANLSTSVEQRSDPRPFAKISILTSDDSLLFLITILGTTLAVADWNGAGRYQGSRCRRPGPPTRLLRGPGSRAWFFSRGRYIYWFLCSNWLNGLAKKIRWWMSR